MTRDSQSDCQPSESDSAAAAGPAVFQVAGPGPVRVGGRAASETATDTATVLSATQAQWQRPESQ